MEKSKATVLSVWTAEKKYEWELLRREILVALKKHHKKIYLVPASNESEGKNV